jgi:hypothetical protein
MLHNVVTMVGGDYGFAAVPNGDCTTAASFGKCIRATEDVSVSITTVSEPSTQRRECTDLLREGCFRASNGKCGDSNTIVDTRMTTICNLRVIARYVQNPAVAIVL